jgi:uncharacterized protein YndB with AHSA1/START domain
VNGILEDLDNGTWRLRFTRELGHPPERVWRAITEPEHLRVWFPQRVEGDWVPGGTLKFVGAGAEDTFEGEVLAVDPPRLLEFRWGTDTIRLEVAERPGGTTLTLLDTIDELGKAARDAAGWHECLDHLAADLDGRPTPPPGETWKQVHPDYAAAFGPAAATLGPPEGH